MNWRPRRAFNQSRGSDANESRARLPAAAAAFCFRFALRIKRRLFQLDRRLVWLGSAFEFEFEFEFALPLPLPLAFGRANVAQSMGSRGHRSKSAFDLNS